MPETFDILVIGAGPGGHAAAASKRLRAFLRLAGLTEQGLRGEGESPPCIG